MEPDPRFIDDRAKSHGLPPILYVQFCNCTCKNRNQYVFAYTEVLVIRGVSDRIKDSFLPVGHHDKDIDPILSIVSSYLRGEDATTQAVLHNLLQKPLNGSVPVDYLKNIGNWYGLYNKENVLHTVSQFLNYRYFSFAKHISKIDHETSQSVSSWVKINVWTIGWFSMIPKRIQLLMLILFCSVF